MPGPKIIEVTVRRRESRAALVFLTQNGLVFDTFPQRDDRVLYRIQAPAGQARPLIDGMEKSLRSMKLQSVASCEDAEKNAPLRGFRALSGRSAARPMAFRLFGVKR